MGVWGRILGVLVVLAGLAFHRGALERYVVFDGTIDSGAVAWAIVAVQLALVVAGVWLFVRAPRLEAPSAGNLALLAFSTLLGVALLEPVVRLAGPGFAPEPRAYVGEYATVDESHNFVADERTGWRMRPGHVFQWRFDGRLTTYRSNAQGFRSERDYVRTARPFVAVVGDSFAFGTGVELEETFGARLEERVGVDVRNYAMPGFGVDQMWMSVRHQVLPDAPEAVVVSFIDDDWLRSLTAYRRVEGFTKPKFKLALGGELVPETPDDAPGALGRFLRRNLRLWGVVEQRVHSLRPWGDRWELNLAILDRLAADCAEAGVPLLLVRVPQRGQREFALLGRELARRGHAFVDVGAHVGRDVAALYLETDDHMNPAGHERIADAIEPWLRGALR